MARPLQRSGFVLLAAVMLVAATNGRANARSTEAGFKMSSGNVYCIIEPPVDSHSVSDLRCDTTRHAI